MPCKCLCTVIIDYLLYVGHGENVKAQPISFGTGFLLNHPPWKDKDAKDNFDISLREHNSDVNSLDANKIWNSLLELYNSTWLIWKQ